MIAGAVRSIQGSVALALLAFVPAAQMSPHQAPSSAPLREGCAVNFNVSRLHS
jgi:hypothetical protein